MQNGSCFPQRFAGHDPLVKFLHFAIDQRLDFLGAYMVAHVPFARRRFAVDRQQAKRRRIVEAADGRLGDRLLLEFAGWQPVKQRQHDIVMPFAQRHLSLAVEVMVMPLPDDALCVQRLAAAAEPRVALPWAIRRWEWKGSYGPNRGGGAPAYRCVIDIK